MKITNILSVKIFALLLLSVFYLSACKQDNRATLKPNIIILFADDISARELPIYGSSVWSPTSGGNTSDPSLRAKTPVLNHLATEGCWIETAWASTVCSPSRAMMMTGRYAHLHKWWQNKDIGTYTDKNEKEGAWPLYASSPHTMAHVAKAGGYATLWAGKTQMKNSDLSMFGFDEGVFTPGGSVGNTSPYTDFNVITKKLEGTKVLINQDNNVEVDYYAQSGWYWKPNVQLMNHPDADNEFEFWPNTKEAQESYGLNTYGPDVELDFVLDFIERKSKEEQPFLVYHTSHLGHDGWDFLNPASKCKWPGTPVITWGERGYTKMAPNITGDSGIYDTHGTVTESGIHTHISYLDFQVWQYINKLEELDIQDNTIFIFCADNGTWGYGKNSPVVQKGTHVPLIIYAPGFDFTKQGKQDILVSLADILPTIAELAGVKIPESYEINGESLWPYLVTDKETHRDWIYSYHMEKQLIRGDLVLRDGNSKWYDVEDQAEDLISFPKITDWNAVSDAHRAERDELEAILPRFDLHDTEHGAPEDGSSMIVDELKIIE